ncbi:hypothetical protein Barb4_02989 [Bacteroidales bacterium Barb4]|nr:hypothetical protein Barb4_02989 [Bacteroidales bacterium Barb4]
MANSQKAVKSKNLTALFIHMGSILAEMII